MPTENQYRAEIVEVGRRLWQRSLVSASDGNISVRLEKDRVLGTPSGVSKGFLEPRDLVLTDLKGEVRGGLPRGVKPTTELSMHLTIYKMRPDINAVVHAHPPVATSFAASGMGLDQCLLPEAAILLGAVPLAPYATPWTDEVPESIRELVPRCDTILLAKHGAVTYGPTLKEAHFKMEILEHSAQVAFYARILGRPTPLTTDELAKLAQLKESFGLTARTLPCLADGTCPVAAPPSSTESPPPSPPDSIDDDQLRERVERAVREALKRLGR